MIVYSVCVEHDDGDRYYGPWQDEWAANAWAETNHTDLPRNVVQWQMLNAIERNDFPPTATPKRSGAT